MRRVMPLRQGFKEKAHHEMMQSQQVRSVPRQLACCLIQACCCLLGEAVSSGVSGGAPEKLPRQQWIGPAPSREEVCRQSDVRETRPARIQRREFMGMLGSDEADVAILENFAPALKAMLAGPVGYPEELGKIMPMRIWPILGGDVGVGHQKALWRCQEVAEMERCRFARKWHWHQYMIKKCH